MSTKLKLEQLSVHLSHESFRIIEDYTDSLNLVRKREVINLLDSYIEALSENIRKNDSSGLLRDFKHIRTHLCQNFVRLTVLNKLNHLYNVTKALIEKGAIASISPLPDKPNTTSTYETYKNQVLPIEFLSKVKKKTLSSDEIFYDTLSRTCSTEIAQRLKEHVYQFKYVKLHRRPLNIFLNFISAEHPRWYENPIIIEESLRKFRNNLLKNLSRQTAYGQFQHVKNSIIVLRDHDLIPKETDFPDNLRRCTKTEKARLDNPILCATNIYDEREKELFKSTTFFIKDLSSEIEYNLKLLLKEARKIVFEGYRNYKDQKRLISISEKKEFLKHPELKVLKTRSYRGKKQIKFETNPFLRNSDSKSKKTRISNLIAYFDHFYECFINGTVNHNINDLVCTNEVKQSLGLTTRLASAMQIIIVEELGINPYSLYKVKVNTDVNGKELVQVTDEGSVRLRALKPRARQSKTRSAHGSLINPIDILEDDIDAATCLKMALEMTDRARKFTSKQELWLCSSKEGVQNPVPETFQNEFNKIRTKAALKCELLNSATLKKIRFSKGVLIYLNSNGDSLKTAQYFGNTVKTTLARYVPDYITELVYRVKIRSFQHILLFMAVAHDESPSDSLGISIENFSNHVKKAFETPGMGGVLYNSLLTQKSDCETIELKYFCVSLKNIMLALKYAKEGDDQNLKDDCLAAISKISEGPIIMKQLLRQAQKNLNIKEDN
ncbi:hypothetical protein ACJ3XJ_10130 [Marinomonas sp. RS-M-Aa-14]